MSLGALTAAELRAIFTHSIQPWLQQQNVGAALPGRARLVMMVGQPGAGKTQALDKISALLPGAVKVMGDDLRSYHPAYRDLMRVDPLSIPEVTAQASGAWVEMSLEYLRAERCSVLVEGTMRKVSVPQRTLDQFRAVGYDTEVNVLAVPLELSSLGIVSRYVEQVQTFGAGRWTPSVIHDTAAEALPVTLQTVIEAGLVDHVVVSDRAGRQLMSRSVDSESDRRLVGAEACLAIEEGRKVGTLTRQQAIDWLVRLERDGHGCLDDCPISQDIARTIHGLTERAGPVAAVAWPTDQTARQRAVTAAGRLGQRVLDWQRHHSDDGVVAASFPKTRPGQPKAQL